MSRDKPGLSRDNAAVSLWREPGRTGTHPLRGVPMSRRPRDTEHSIQLSESESTGPSHRVAVGGTLSRFVSVSAGK
jgi:hypothetical protein